MYSSIVSVGVASGWALCVLATAAEAHVPFIEEVDFSQDHPYVVHDVGNSKSIHAKIGTVGDVDVYRIDLDEPTRIFTKTDVPWCPQYESFGVTYALAGPGLPAPASPLPVMLPPGYGAIVVRDNSTHARETWIEPFSGRRIWLGAEAALDDAPAGTYEMIVWNERGQTGDYIAVIGEAEIFNAPEIRQATETSPKLRDGADLMVKCNPTVAKPQRPSFSQAQPPTQN